MIYKVIRKEKVICRGRLLCSGKTDTINFQDRVAETNPTLAATAANFALGINYLPNLSGMLSKPPKFPGN